MSQKGSASVVTLSTKNNSAKISISPSGEIVCRGDSEKSQPS